jgi:hypothetical protein
MLENFSVDDEYEEQLMHQLDDHVLREAFSDPYGKAAVGQGY